MNRGVLVGNLSLFLSFLALCFPNTVSAQDKVKSESLPLILAQITYDPGSTGKYPTKVITPRFMFDNEKWLALDQRLARKSEFEHTKRGEPIPSVTTGLPPFPTKWLSFDQTQRVTLSTFARAVFGYDENVLRQWHLPPKIASGEANGLNLFAKDGAQIRQACEPGWVLEAEVLPDEPEYSINSWVSNQPASVVLSESIVEEALPSDVRSMFFAAFKEEEAWQLASWSAGAAARNNPAPHTKIPASVESLQARPLHSWKGASLAFPDGTEIFSFEIIKTYKDFSPDSCGIDVDCNHIELCDQAPFTFQGFGLKTQDGMLSMLDVKSWYGMCGEGNRPGANKVLRAGVTLGGRNYPIVNWYGLEAVGTALYEIDQKNWLELARQGSGC